MTRLIRFCLIVTLLAVLSVATGCSASRPADEAYEGYLFAYFGGNGPDREQVYFAVSKDGFNYKALNASKPVIEAQAISRSGGVRDPHLLRGYAGEYFYMVLTDLHVPTMGWNNTAMVMLRSKDLINWQSSVVDIPSQFPQAFGDVNRVWAPQTIYDEQAEQYMVYFSMKQGDGPDIIYYAYANDDFTGLASTPKQLYFPPNEKHACIDGDIVEKDGKYHLFFKGEGRDPGIRLAVSGDLTGGYKLVSDERVDAETAAVEGSGVFKLNDRDAWILMYDVYTRGRYQFTISEDLKSFRVVDEQVTMNFKPRHGSVLPITGEEMARLIDKWGPIEAGPADDGWQKNRWAGDGVFTFDRADDRWVLELASGDGGDIAWSRWFAVEPGKTYELAAKIRTRDVIAGEGRGALLNVHGLSGAQSPALTGDTDWTTVKAVFNSGERERVLVNCLLGGWGQSTGRASFKHVSLRAVAAPKRPAVVHEPGPVTIDAAALRPPMSELIYSQFIEHMGRCIYGGIWAEMLEDRKFYHPITSDYKPYGSSALFPPVVRSPWQVLGSPAAVKMVTADPFVGDHDPQIGPGATIQQHGLGVVKGKRYTGYIWLKAVEGSPTVTVSLDLSDKPVRIEPRGDAYTRYEIEFSANKSSDKAMFAISVADGTARVGTASLMPADNIDGMRADTLQLLKQLKSPMYRWPGGNFVSGYDWRDGVGDRDRRPPRTNPAWTGVEHNDFGMHEFIRFCAFLNAEPMITINMGFEGAFSAEAEMQYANGGPATHWGAQRAANGSERPFGVKYWCIGNEMWGDWQLGFMSPEDYQIKHNWVVDRLRSKHKGFVAIGSGNAGDWSRGLLARCAGRMDLIAEHFYCQQRDGVVEHVAQMTRSIRGKADFHRHAQAQLGLTGDKQIPIAMTEWNYWYGPHPYGELGTVYFLKDALGVAAGIHEYARCSDIIGAAFYAQAVNVIGCIKTTKTDAFLAATALPLIMYREHFGAIPVQVDAAEPRAPGLDIAAAWTAGRAALTIGVVNASPEPKTIDLKLKGVAVSGEAEKWWFAGNDPELKNDVATQRLTIQHADDVKLSDEIRVPGYSATIFRLRVE